MSEVDQNDEASVDVGPAGIPFNTVRYWMRINDRIFDTKHGDPVLNRTGRKGQFGGAIDHIYGWRGLKNHIACRKSYICAKMSIYLRVQGGERKIRTTMNKPAIVQLPKLLQHACDSPLHDVSRERFCRRQQSEMFVRKSSNVQHQTQVMAMMTFLHEGVVQIEVAPAAGES